MSLSKEREEEIKAAIKKEVWGTNSLGLDVIKDLFSEIDLLRAENWKLQNTISKMSEQISWARHALKDDEAAE